MYTPSSVSVVIPTFNRLDYLIKAVESCIAQKWSNLEIIIVDDGSQDGTKAKIEAQLKEEWKNCGIHYLFQENSGASSARNVGLKVAEGDYIQFLDSDDELLPGKIQKQVTYLEEPANANCQMCYCYGRIGEYADNKYQRIGVETTSAKDLLRQLVSRTTHVMSTPAPLWRKSYLNINYYWNTELALGDDLEYSVRLTCDLERVGFIPQELFFVREHQGSRLSTDNMTQKSLASAILTQKLIHSCLIRSGYWSSEISEPFFDGVRILYSNCLCYGDEDDIIVFESWLQEISRGASTFRRLNFLISFRRLFGAKALLGIHQGIIKFRQLF